MSGTQETIDEIRGELDRDRALEPGWSGPATDAYMRGYGTHPQQREHAEAATYRETHHNHGWYT